MPRADRHAAERDGRRLALAALFEADFGQHTAGGALERELAAEGVSGPAADLARQLVGAVVAKRDQIDARIERLAPQYRVLQLARIDRALLRSAIAELLHCPTPARVAIAEWVELARTYSGEPARRLVNGVLGRVAGEAQTNRRGGPDRRTGGSTDGSFDI